MVANGFDDDRTRSCTNLAFGIKVSHCRIYFMTRVEGKLLWKEEV